LWLVVGELQKVDEAADESRCLGIIDNALAWGGTGSGRSPGAGSRDGLCDGGSGDAAVGARHSDGLGDEGSRSSRDCDSNGLL